MRRRFLLVGSLILTSCSRSHYRQSADRETYPAVIEHVVTPANAVGRIDLQPAPGSRLADPFDPDHPPKPPDDSTAARFMRHPDRFTGSRHWGKDGYADRVEPEGWEKSLDLEPDGTLKLTQDKAVAVALANSREYQTNLELVYVTALSLTLNRFEFDARWFGRNGTTYTRTGFAGPPAAVGTLDTTTNIGFDRNFAAGGQLLVDFANGFVWEYSGGTSRLSGNFAATFIQPLLRNFGRKVRLEGLTQAERDTLYAVRDFARFRKQFWVNTAVDSGGYLSLLLLQQAVRNARANLKSQEENYQLGLELFKGNKKSAVEVDAIFQGLLAARQQVVNAEISLEQALDAFKIQLGLPPRLRIELDESYLDQFVLVPPASEAVGDEIAAFGKARNAELGNPPPAEALRKHHDDLLLLVEKVGPGRDAADADLKRWKAAIDGPADPADDAELRGRVAAAFAQQAEQVAPQRQALVSLRTRVRVLQSEVADGNREAAWTKLTKAATELGNVVGAAIAAQTQARIYLIRLPDVDAAEAGAVAEAKANRLDLQNSLARVTDAWRRVAVAANQLDPDLALVARTNLVPNPDGGNPVDFSKDLSSYSVGLQFAGPLNRVAERNRYRVSLIDYQRARRDYMQLSDAVEQQIRNDLRTLRLQRISFEIARQSLIAAARQLENEQLLLTAPNQAQANTGDATLRKLRALDQLQAARDQLAGSFIRYEQQRVRLLLDLEALQLDERGYPTNVLPDRRPAPVGTVAGTGSD